MTRTCAVWILVATLGECTASAQDAESRFEVVSIRPSDDGEWVPNVRLAGGRYTARGLTAGQLIGAAYGESRSLARQQLVNGPQWIAETRYDIEAFSPDALEMTSGRFNAKGKAMLRSLIADRFGLKAHFETREQQVLVLQVARADRQLGPSLKPRREACMSPTLVTDSRQTCGGSWGLGRISANGYSMTDLANSLSGLVPEIDRFVVDRTELTGIFEIDLRWSPEMSGSNQLAPGQQAPIRALPGTDGPSFFTALREQLGLKLEPSREPIPVLVIDSIHRPTEN